MDAELTKLAAACERAAEGMMELAFEYEHEAKTTAKRWRIDALTEQAKLARATWQVVKNHAAALRAGRVTVNEGGENG